MAEVIYAASVSPTGEWKYSAVRCRLGPGHRRCLGRVRVRPRDDQIEWTCPVCNDHGVITHWKDSPYDLCTLREVPNRPTLAVTMPDEEYDEVSRCDVLDPESTAVVYRASPTGEGIVLKATAEDFEILAEFLSFEANHEVRRKRRQALDRAVARIHAILQEVSSSSIGHARANS